MTNLDPHPWTESNGDRFLTKEAYYTGNPRTIDPRPEYEQDPMAYKALVVEGSTAKGYAVRHAASGLLVPFRTPDRAGAFTSDLHRHDMHRMRLKSVAKAWLSAVEGSGLPLNRKPTHDEVIAFRDWLIATYPQEKN